MSNYNFSSKILHHIALASPMIGQICFDIECGFNRNSSSPKEPVFVVGLARAGTTMLMNNLYQSGEFTSLTYRNMPFVLMPQLWAKFSTPFEKHKEKEERAHGDGVMVNFDSAEAFEEIFWRCFDKDSYISKKMLNIHAPNDNIIDNFRKFVSNVVAGNSNKRYLSKNNNNLLRLPSLKKSFPDATIIIPFRDPIQHAISMFKQHNLFSKMHNEDKFSLKYMKWLGHYEFGLGHRPFAFDEKKFSEYEPDKIDYWVDYWIYVYNFLLEKAPDECNFICYEDLCGNPGKVLGKLYEIINVDKDLLKKEEIRSVIRHDEPDISDDTRKTAYKIYEDIRKRAFYS